MRRRLSLTLLCLLALAGSAQAQPQPRQVDPDPDGCGAPADDDPATRKDRAGEHYRRGQELYAMGEFARSIPEFYTTYCLVPVPEAIFNIGQAYERLVDFERAVTWFERYIRSLPGDATEERDTVANRVAVLRRLPARIRVATDPPGAAIELVGGDQPLRARANDSAPMLVPSGRYEMRVSLVGHEPVRETITAEIGQPYTYSFQLKPQTGLLRVTASPSDARIFVDKRLVGAGSFVDRVPVGRHEITAEAVGRAPRTATVTVIPDQTAATYLNLPAPEGRSKGEFLTASTLFGLVGAGTLASVPNDSDDEGAIVAMATLFGGIVGFSGPYLAFPDGLPTSTSSLLIGGATWGALEGVGVALLFSDDSDAYGLAGVGTSVAFTAAAALAAPRLSLSAGDAALLNSGGIWGSAAGMLFWSVFVSASTTEERLFGPMLLAGLNLGLLTGGAMAAQLDYSRSHVALIDLAGVTGAVAGVALAGAFEDQFQENRVSHFMLGGIGVGLTVGAILTRKMDLTSGTALAELPTPTVSVAQAADGQAVPVLSATGEF